MPLANYGLLTGTLKSHGDQHGGNPHYLLEIQAGSTLYRAAVNLESTLGDGAPPELQYQMVADLSKGNARAKALAAGIANQDRFVLASEGSPTLDFVRGGFLNMDGFTTIPRGTSPENNAYYSALVEAADQAVQDTDAYVAVFGTGYSDSGSSNAARASFGFNGVDNVHMNQGSYYEIGSEINQHYAENGPNQDGAVLFFLSNGAVQGFFSKFQSQDTETTADGNPVHTNVAALNAIAPKIARALTAAVARRKKRAAAILAEAAAASVRSRIKTAAKRPAKSKGGRKSPAAGPAPVPSGFVFNEPPGAVDPVRPFQTDNDSNVDQTFVNQFAANGVPEPVPGPRGGVYPVMKLEDVVGAAAVQAITKAGQIVIHTVGDTGAPEISKLPNETAVADLMLKDFTGAAASQPAFLYHLGDVVYYFGEQNYYYDQFYKPYSNYPRPIFAIPGNHDGITYSAQMQSLAPFLKAFCDSAPSHWTAAGGLARTTMTQPGVYFTLDAPFVSVIGLYSNCSENYGYLDQQQTLFLYNELVRLKPLRASGQIAAVLLAVHHPPMSYAASKPSSQSLRNDFDQACQQADFWPDAVFSGHAHIYQRMTRTVQADSASRQIPHLVCGAGGYNITASQEVDIADMKTQDSSDPQFRLHQFLAQYGYMKLTITPAAGKQHGTLRMEFVSPNINAGSPADVCVFDLDAHQWV